MTDVTPLPTSNLSHWRKPLLGRQGELERLRALLAPGGQVQICGPAGMGKSHLAQALAHQVSAAWAQLWWLDVSGCRDPASLHRVACATLDLPGAADLSTVWAGRGELLLILDGADQLSPLAWGELQGWRRAAPQMGVLLTARAAQAGAQEALCLGPLPPAQARALFLSRAHLLVTTARQEARIWRSVEELLALLEGHPLALELMAASLQTYSLGGRALELPAAAAQDGRPQVLEAALSWVLRHLTGDTLEVARACACIPGAFSPAVLESICPRGQEALWTELEALTRLGLLLHEPDQRLRLLPKAARLLRDALPPEERTRALQAQARFVLEREGGLESLIRQTRSFSPMEARLCQDLELFYALYQELRPLDRPLAVQLGSLLCFGGFSLFPKETLLSLSVALVEDAEFASEELRFYAWMMRCRALLSISQDKPRALEALERARALSLQTGAPLHRLGVSQQEMIVVSFTEDDPEAERRVQTQALELARALEVPAVEAQVLYQRGYHHLHKLEYEQSHHTFLELEGLVRRHQLGKYAVHVHWAMGELHMTHRRNQEALACYARALEVEGQESRLTAVTFCMLGYACFGAGELGLAHSYLERCCGLERSLGACLGTPVSLLLLALVARERGEEAAAVAYHERLLREEERLPALAVGSLWWRRIVSRLLYLERGLFPEAQRLQEVIEQHRCLEQSSLVRAGRLFWIWEQALPPQLPDAARGRLRQEVQAILAPGEPTPLWPVLDGVGRWLLAHLEAPAQRALRLRRDLSCFCYEGREVSIQRRAALKRILGALARHHEQRPSPPLDIEALFEVGWPGQGALPESRQARVYNAISRLRRLGLSSALVHDGDGYRLAPELVLRWD